MLARYSSPVYLWILIPVFLFWNMRIWLKAVRGVLHDNPMVVFAARDWVSRLAQRSPLRRCEQPEKSCAC